MFIIIDRLLNYVNNREHKKTAQTALCTSLLCSLSKLFTTVLTKITTVTSKMFTAVRAAIIHDIEDQRYNHNHQTYHGNDQIVDCSTQ